MKKGLHSTQCSGSVHVTFNVSKDVASHIRQSVVSSWKSMQDLGVVSVQLDKEQLKLDNSGPCVQMSKIQSTEFRRLFNGSAPVLDSCCRSSRGRKASRNPRSRVNKRARNNDTSCQSTDKELCSSTVSVASMVQEGSFCKIGNIASQSFNQDKEVAHLTSSEQVLSASVQRLLSSQLPNCMSSDITLGGTALNADSRAMCTNNPFITNVLQPKLDEVGSAITLNTLQSHDLPPPSTPFVPKRRKRRKPADSSLEVASVKAPSYVTVNDVDHTMLPTHISGNIEATSNFSWQNCNSRRFQLNGHYPHEFSSPVFCRYAVNNAGTEFSLTTTTELENTGIISVKRNVIASSNQLLPLGSNVSCPSRVLYGQLCQPMVPVLSQACSTNLSHHFSQGILESRHHNPDTYGARAATSAETVVSDCAERLCRTLNSQLCDASLHLPAERKSCLDVSRSSSALAIKQSEPESSLTFDVNSLAPVLKSSESLSSNSVDVTENIRCTSAVASTSSVCSSSKSANFVVQSDVIHNNQSLSSSAVVKKHKSNVVNGIYFSPDSTPVEAWHAVHMLVPFTVANKPDVCLSADTNVDTDKTAADDSSFTKPASNNDASHMARSLHSARMQSTYELAVCQQY